MKISEENRDSFPLLLHKIIEYKQHCYFHTKIVLFYTYFLKTPEN